MKLIATHEPFMLHNGLGARWKMYRHGRFIYRHVKDVNGNWERLERGRVDKGRSDESATYADTPETKRGKKWVS